MSLIYHSHKRSNEKWGELIKDEENKNFVRKSYELKENPDINIAVIIDYKGCYFSNRSVDQETWLLSIEQIISHSIMRSCKC